MIDDFALGHPDDLVVAEQPIALADLPAADQTAFASIAAGLNDEERAERDENLVLKRVVVGDTSAPGAEEAAVVDFAKS